MSEKKLDVKKIIIAVIAVIIIAAVIIIVVNINKKSNNDSTETQTAENTLRSGQIDIDYEKQVTSLADYSAIPITLDSSYEVTDEAMQDYLTQLLVSYGGTAYKAVTDRDTVAEGDYVNVDYTGYQDGEAFSGGSAEGTLLDISNNSAVGGSSFIDGFTTPVIGAKIGDTVSGDVTFPESYGQESLAGQTVTFEYTINGIYTQDPTTFDDLTDENVNTVFGTYGVTTVEALKTQLQSDLEQSLYSAKVDALKDYMVENCTVEIPDEYLQARLNEYIVSFEEDNITDEDTTLEDYLNDTYGITLESAKETWTTNLTEQIEVEFIFGLIAKKEGIEVDEDSFDSYVSYIVSASNSQLEDADAVYEYFGSGNKDEGETYLRQQYLVNKAIDLVAENAKVTFEDSDTNTEE